MTVEELDIIKIARNIPEKKLKKGMIGTVVHIHKSPSLAYLIEFSDRQGRTNALYSLLPEEIQKVKITREEYEHYLNAGELPYNAADTFCVDPNS